MENYKSKTNCNPNNEEEMALDRPYTKKTNWIHTEVGIGLEPSGGSTAQSSQKTWKRMIEDEAMEEGKTWSEVKRLAVDRTH
jgi:hypothetical protein